MSQITDRNLPLEFGEGMMICTFNGAHQRPFPLVVARVSPDTDDNGKLLKINPTMVADVPDLTLFTSYVAINTRNRTKIEISEIPLIVDGDEGVDEIAEGLSPEDKDAILSRFENIIGAGSLTEEQALRIGARSLALREEYRKAIKNR